MSFFKELLERYKKTPSQQSETQPQIEQISIPTSKEEANQILANMAILEQTVNGYEVSMNEELFKIRKRWEEMATPIVERYSQFEYAITEYANQNRDLLTKSGKTKTVKCNFGEFAWRTSSPSIEIKDEIAVIEQIKQLLKDEHSEYKVFLKQIDSLNKNAMLANPELAKTLKGVSIKSGDEAFKIKPLYETLTSTQPMKN